MVISAACHAGPTEAGSVDLLSVQEVQWGVTRAAEKGVYGHCAFSSDEVGAPVEGVAYQGFE